MRGRVDFLKLINEYIVSDKGASAPEAGGAGPEAGEMETYDALTLGLSSNQPPNRPPRNLL